MSGEYVARWFQEDDLEAYIQGLNKYLYDESNEEVFHWKWRLNPHRLGRPP